MKASDSVPDPGLKQSLIVHMSLKAVMLKGNLINHSLHEATVFKSISCHRVCLECLVMSALQFKPKHSQKKKGKEKKKQKRRGRYVYISTHSSGHTEWIRIPQNSVLSHTHTRNTERERKRKRKMRGKLKEKTPTFSFLFARGELRLFGLLHIHINNVFKGTVL